MSILVVHPQEKPLKGIATVPGDKSISHRAVMLASLAQGPSQIQNWLPAGDTIATLDAMQGLGVRVTVERQSDQAWDLMVEGRGLHGLRKPKTTLDCRNAGTCMRLLAGILAGQSFSTVLDGSPQLRQRPMNRIIDPLTQMGARIKANNGRAPLSFEPASLKGIRYLMPMASAQVKSAVLLAGLYAAGDTQVVQPGPARDHTERMLQAMGAPLTVEGDTITLGAMDGKDRSLSLLDLSVPGDLSSAAFLLVAAMIVPHSSIAIKGVGFNETRTGLLDILSSMGAQIEKSNDHLSGGERLGDLEVRFEELHGTKVGGELVVRSIDELPVWAVAASQAAGLSALRDAAELRVKEVDRIRILAGELGKMGLTLDEQPDGFTVKGPCRLQGADVDSHGDHRLGMALAVAGLVGTGPTRVHNAGCIADSYPGFVETMRSLGSQIREIPDS
jgi:3-phosphoshikimate 1-carboxyvinyltransferase